MILQLETKLPCDPETAWRAVARAEVLEPGPTTSLIGWAAARAALLAHRRRHEVEQPGHEYRMVIPGVSALAHDTREPSALVEAAALLACGVALAVWIGIMTGAFPAI